MRQDDVDRLVVALEQVHSELAARNQALVEANLALARSRERYQALYELAPTPYVTIDEGGAILEVNQASKELLVSDALVGRQLESFIAADFRTELRALARAVFASGSRSGCELELERTGETRLEIMVDAIPTGDTPTGTRGCLMSLVDITARKRAEASARALDRRIHHLEKLESLEALAGGVAHTFNNLLTVVATGAELVREVVELSSPAAAALDDALAATRDSTALARQMLEYAGQRSALLQPLELAHVLRALEPRIATVAKNVRLLVEPGPAAIDGDPAQLSQLVMNLVTNAVEAMVDRPGTIVVALGRFTLGRPDLDRLDFAGAAQPGTYVRLDVRDTGAGMTDATRARIFEPFFSTKSTGRGLGLAVVQGITRGHGGAIEVTSGVGAGTCVSVWLPGSTRIARPAPTDVNPIQITTGTLLVIDDDVRVAASLQRILQRAGFDVTIAHDGATALDTLRETDRLDAVLVDLTMPGLDGVTCAIRFRELRPALPIVLCTGFGTVPKDVDTLFDAVLYKPFDRATLLATLSRVMTERSAPRFSSSPAPAGDAG